MQMLSTPLTDDPMETDADRRGELGDDIDIDIDFAGDQLLDEEDEAMSEGAIELNEQILATTPQATDLFDDEMADDGNHQETLYDTNSVQDENLGDVQNLNAAQPNPAAVHQQWLASGGNPKYQAPQQQNLQNPSNLQYHASGTNPGLYGQQPAISNGIPQAFSQESGNRSAGLHKGNEYQEEAGNAGLEANLGSVGQYEMPSTSLKENDVIQKKSLEQPPTVKKAENRRVTVLYDGTELSLCRSVGEDQDFLLEDEQLMDESIEKLLAACKPVLGEDVHNHELVIGADDLDLEISEFAVEAAVTSVSHLNDLYAQLQINDGIESPKALHLNLYSRPSISDRLSYLREAVKNGTGLSVVSRLLDSPTADSDDEGVGGIEDNVVLLAHDADEQNHDESSETVEQEDKLSVQSDSATVNTSAWRRRGSLPNIKAASRSSTVNLKVEEERSAGGENSTNPEHQEGVQDSSGDHRQVDTKKTWKETKQQEGERESGAGGNGDDDVINFEDHDTVEPKASSRTTIRDEGGSAKNQEGKNNRIEGRDEGDKPEQGVSEQSQAKNGDSNAANEDKEPEAAGQLGNSVDIEGDFGDDSPAYHNIGGENEYGTTLEGDVGNEATQQDSLNYESSIPQPETVDAGQEESDNLVTNIDDLEEPVDFGNQTDIQPETFFNDEDEITFEDDEGQLKSSDVGQDQLLNPQSLKKRSRTHTDADDETPTEPQDAKRIRSN